MATVGELLAGAARRLASVSQSPRLDAELLLARVLERDRTWLFTWPDKTASAEQQAAFRALIDARAEGKPVAWLLGEREFHGHLFRVTPDTLIPRPDTELLVDLALRLLPGSAQTLADLGTGSGAVGISLALARPQWSLLLTDIDAATLDVARDNATRLQAGNCDFLLSDWLEQVPAGLDAVVSNPPYVADGDPHLEQGDVRFEPRRALTAGADGLDAVRAILTGAVQRLRPDGLLALEHGYDQGASVRTLFLEAGFTDVATEKDLAGQDRVTHGRWHAQ